MSTATSPQQTPASGTPGGAPAATALRLVESDTVDDHVRHRSRNAFRDEEHDLQGHALALASTCVRARAGRYAEAVERGAVLSAEQVDALVRAFRAYRPFLSDVDRAKDDAARRRLARAVEQARSRRPDAGATQDASVA